jgi:hypothetical protein
MLLGALPGQLTRELLCERLQLLPQVGCVQGLGVGVIGFWGTVAGRACAVQGSTCAHGCSFLAKWVWCRVRQFVSMGRSGMVSVQYSSCRRGFQIHSWGCMGIMCCALCA